MRSLIKMRRILELLALAFFVIIVITISSKWSSSPNYKHKHLEVKRNNIPMDLLLRREEFLKRKDNNIITTEKLVNGQPDLAKYVHLDLKGAPPRAHKFYEGFFNFVDKLQMGVKGVLIEYEDTLPLQGKLANVSIDR